MIEMVHEEVNHQIQAKFRELRDQIKDSINNSGPLSDEDMSILVSAVEQADAQQIELLRTYVRALSTEGLYSVLRIASLVQLSAWNEASGRMQTQHFLKKEVLEKK